MVYRAIIEQPRPKKICYLGTTPLSNNQIVLATQVYGFIRFILVTNFGRVGSLSI